MKNNLAEKIKQTLAEKKRSRRRKGIVGALALAVFFLTALVLVHPAMTAESGGDRDGGTLYSSNLEDFVVGVTIRDGDGNVIPPDGTVYIGESYMISVQFSEDNIAGQEKQFEYNSEGWLTYQMPSFFTCAPVTNGELTDGLGNVVGTYNVDSSGLLRVRFIDGYIDSSKTSVSITMSATASNTVAPGIQQIDFGGYIIEVNVSGDGQLNVTKTAGKYDPRTHSIEYEVEVKAKYGTITDIALTDTPLSAGLNVDWSSVTYTALDGVTPYAYPPTTLEAGEGYIVHYRAYLDPSIYQGKNSVDYRAKNKAVATGESDGNTVTSEDTAEKHISTRFLRKSGKDDPANGRIRWKVTVGDGSNIVDGFVLTDTPGAGLTFDTASGISVTPYTYDTAGNLIAGAEFTIPFGSNPQVITLPSGMGAYVCELVYYTDYTLEEGVISQEFTNTVGGHDNEHGNVQHSTTTTGHAVGAPPDVTKTVTKSADGTALHYSIEVFVPESLNGTSGFYLYDYFTEIQYAGTRYYFGKDITNLSVYTENSQGDIRDYAPAAVGSTNYVYLTRFTSNPREMYIGFNTSTPNTSLSKWIETEDVTLHIEYDLPLDSPVYIRLEGANYVPADGVTFRDIVELGRPVKNRARIYHSAGLLYEQDDAEYLETNLAPFKKTGKIASNGDIEYTVVFNNRNPDMSTVLQKGMKEMIFSDELLTDGMSYVDGSLYCDIYNDTLTRIRTTYRYAPQISGSTSLNASAQDFVWYSGDNPSYNTLYKYIQRSLIGGDSNSTSRLVFRYKVHVDTGSPIFATTDPTVLLSNEARLTGIMSDDTPLDTGVSHCDVEYGTQIVKKEVEHAEGSNRADFTITLNPMGIDLLEGVTQMTVIDRMTANLVPVLSGLKVYLKQEGSWIESETVYTYDQEQNTLTFTLPDDVPIKITYTTLITETGENVSIGNSIALDGYAEYSSVVDAEFTVDEFGGAAHSDSFRLTLLKQSSFDHRPLANAVFALYGPPNSEREGNAPAGTPATVSVNGQTLRYYTSYVTGPNGTVELETNDSGIAMFSVQGLYALKEISAPEGYQLSDELISFYADELPSGGSQSATVMLSETPLVVSNDPKTFVLPETGGAGTEPIRAAGLALVAAALAALIRRLLSGKKAET